MSQLTKAEKLARYDSLQTAIKYTVKSLKGTRADCEARYKNTGKDEVRILAAYSKGQADAYGHVIEFLERWAD